MKLYEGRNIVLIGLMGAGKTTVGRILAERLDRPFFDTDDLVEREAGKTVAAIFAEEGERGFRAREAEVIRGVAALRGRVIAVGGGAVTSPANVTHLRGTGDLVWLDAEPDELAARVSAEGLEVRPLLAASGEAAARLAELRSTRRQAYLRAASHTIATGGREPAAIADEVLAWADQRPGLLAREERQA